MKIEKCSQTCLFVILVLRMCNYSSVLKFCGVPPMMYEAFLWIGALISLGHCVGFGNILML